MRDLGPTRPNTCHNPDQKSDYRYDAFLADMGFEMIHYTTVNVYHSSPSQTFLDSRGEVRVSKNRCDRHTNAGSNSQLCSESTLMMCDKAI